MPPRQQQARLKAAAAPYSHHRSQQAQNENCSKNPVKEIQKIYRGYTEDIREM
jgi:hypothetical protein